jgi:hypothetical protein
MAKRLNTTFWTGAELKADADIPDQADMSTGAAYCDCSNISLSDVYDLMTGSSGSGTALSLHDICQLDETFVAGGEEGKINAWARYKPGNVTYNIKLPANCYDNPTFTWNAANPSRLGDWAGYHHAEDTLPTYWDSKPSSDMGNYVEGGATTEVMSGLKRGKCGCVLQGDPEDEYYWGRVKVQVYTKVGAGAYSLLTTTDFIDLDDFDDVLFTINDNSETAGNTYGVCLRPVYINISDTVEAVIEGGVAEFTYDCVTIVDYASLTVTDVATDSYQSTGETYCDFDFNLNNGIATTIHVDVRLTATSEVAGDFPFYFYLYNVEVPASSSAHLEATLDQFHLNGDIVDDGTFDLNCYVSVVGSGVWVDAGRVKSGMDCWANI